MTQENKELLLKDLCARLYYGVKVTNGIYTITLTPCSDTSIIIKNEHILPYLRPMSSMTDEEKKELQEIAVALSYNKYDIIIGAQINSFRQLDGVLDLFNAHHFDYRDLIEKGLALEAPEGMYNIN